MQRWTEIIFATLQKCIETMLQWMCTVFKAKCGPNHIRLCDFFGPGSGYTLVLSSEWAQVEVIVTIIFYFRLGFKIKFTTFKSKNGGKWIYFRLAHKSQNKNMRLKLTHMYKDGLLNIRVWRKTHLGVLLYSILTRHLGTWLVWNIICKLWSNKHVISSL